MRLALGSTGSHDGSTLSKTVSGYGVNAIVRQGRQARFQFARRLFATQHARLRDTGLWSRIPIRVQ